MQHKDMEISPHPQFLDVLFAYKGKVYNIFKDVLGLYEIHHISVSCINNNGQLLTFSSTPALEFNLFSSQLWRYDKTFHIEWISQYTQSCWQSLYAPVRYDELYYIKQLKHRYPLALALGARIGKLRVIYAIASRKQCAHTQDLFRRQHEHFYKIGQYCTDLLLPLFIHRDPSFLDNSTLQAMYETSN